MDIKGFFRKNWIHFAVVIGFIITAFLYFGPQFDGYGLKQHDIEQYKGAANEIKHHREVHGEEPLWTNSMFGGMPATQVSLRHNGNLISKGIGQFMKLFPSPAGIFLLHLLFFYIMAMMLRVKPLIAVLGAIAFAFASYEIIILQAGHNSKAMAVAVAPAVIGAFVYAYRQNWKWGAILSALFMSIELAMNHLQVTYYLGFLLLGLGIFFAVEAIQKKELKKFCFGTAAIGLGYVFALMINYGNIAMTNDYAQHTIRGGNDITLNPDGTESKIATGGLDKEYITNWSYGKGETFTLVSPYVKGSHSEAVGTSTFKELPEKWDYVGERLDNVNNQGLYFGEQTITSGPVYLGVLTLFLAVLGLVFLKDRIKWVYLAITILAIMLSWGKNFMGFTEFFINNVPGYDKFRTVTIILVMVELCIPIIGIMLLQKLYENRENLKEQKKKFYIVSGAFFVFLVGLKMVGVNDNFSAERERESYNEEQIYAGISQQLMTANPEAIKQQRGIDINIPAQREQLINEEVDRYMAAFDDIQSFRKDLVSWSFTRSIIVGVFAILIMSLFFLTAIPSPYLLGGLIVLMLADLVPVNQNYLSSVEGDKTEYKFWTSQAEKDYPLSSNAADEAIMEAELKDNPKLQKLVAQGESKGKKHAAELEYDGKDKRRVIDDYRFAALGANTNYRVMDFNGIWQSARASYFHKAMGGYHGAKLRNIQNLFNYHIASYNNNVIDMLNIKYTIQGAEMRPNPLAMGNAWLVQSVEAHETPDDEIRGLGSNFKLTNIGGGNFLVNGETIAEANVYGRETIEYLVGQGADTMKIQMPNGVSLGDTISYAMDTNGMTNWVPMMTLRADSARNTFRPLVQLEVLNTFTPKTEAVMLKSEAEKLSKRTFSGEGSVKLTSYRANKLSYTAEIKDDKQLVVFSEIYYPDGWIAKVDGKEYPILKVNYLLRGLELPKGKHKIEFTYSSETYETSNMYSMIGSVILILGLLFFTYHYVMERRKVDLEPVKEETQE